MKISTKLVDLFSLLCRDKICRKPVTFIAFLFLQIKYWKQDLFLNWHCFEREHLSNDVCENKITFEKQQLSKVLLLSPGSGSRLLWRPVLRGVSGGGRGPVHENSLLPPLPGSGHPVSGADDQSIIWSPGMKYWLYRQLHLYLAQPSLQAISSREIKIINGAKAFKAHWYILLSFVFQNIHTRLTGLGMSTISLNNESSNINVDVAGASNRYQWIKMYFLFCLSVKRFPFLSKSMVLLETMPISLLV